MDKDGGSNFLVPTNENNDALFEACGKRFGGFEKSMNMDMNMQLEK